MFAVLVASFVIAACLMVSVLVTLVLRHESRNRAWLDQQIAEDVEAGVFDIPVVWTRQMDVPGKYPAIRTRNTKVW